VTCLRARRLRGFAADRSALAAALAARPCARAAARPRRDVICSGLAGFASPADADESVRATFAPTGAAKTIKPVRMAMIAVTRNATMSLPVAHAIQATNADSETVLNGLRLAGLGFLSPVHGKIWAKHEGTNGES